MTRLQIVGVALAVAIVAFGVWYWFVLNSASQDVEPSGIAFSETGNVTRDNPGQEPGVWYLIYEEPGAPGKSAALDLSGIAAPELSQGDRVHIEGFKSGSLVSVTSISKVDSGRTIPVLLYYYDPARDQGPGGAQCSSAGLVAVEREIPQTTTPLRDTIELLLAGELTEAERTQGLTTEFPLPGVSLENAIIEDGVATLTFNDPQSRTSGGSCRVGILWLQIKATAEQFPTVNEARFQPEELFQP